MAAASRRAHSLNGVPTLPIVDDYAAGLAGAPVAPASADAALAATDLPTAGVRVHGTRLRRGGRRLADPLLARRQVIVRRLSRRRTGRSVAATDAHTMIDYQHRSPTR